MNDFLAYRVAAGLAELGEVGSQMALLGQREAEYIAASTRFASPPPIDPTACP